MADLDTQIAAIDLEMSRLACRRAVLSARRGRIVGGLASGAVRQNAQRDRDIVEAYHLMGGRRGAIAAIAAKFGVGRRTVERALETARRLAKVSPVRRARGRVAGPLKDPAVRQPPGTRGVAAASSTPTAALPDIFGAVGMAIPEARSPILPSARRKSRPPT